jgi:hypothetical protein
MVPIPAGATTHKCDVWLCVRAVCVVCRRHRTAASVFVQAHSHHHPCLQALPRSVPSAVDTFSGQEAAECQIAAAVAAIQGHARSMAASWAACRPDAIGGADLATYRWAHTVCCGCGLRRCGCVAVCSRPRVCDGARMRAPGAPCCFAGAASRAQHCPAAAVSPPAAAPRRWSCRARLATRPPAAAWACACACRSLTCSTTQGASPAAACWRTTRAAAAAVARQQQQEQQQQARVAWWSVTTCAGMWWRPAAAVTTLPAAAAAAAVTQAAAVAEAGSGRWCCAPRRPYLLASRCCCVTGTAPATSSC